MDVHHLVSHIFRKVKDKIQIIANSGRSAYAILLYVIFVTSLKWMHMPIN